ncbi:MAG: hypothetical protein HY685_07105 [Chloroflexi bacterium]|nr:hypothetical protein [Chloroflexota bacterium]
MAVVVGQGAYTYELDEGWGKLPEGWEFSQVGAVGVDSQDRVYVFTRSAHPLMVFDRGGKLLWNWGEEVIQDAHGICIGPDGTIYLVDRQAQVVRVVSPEGKVLLTLGNLNQPSDTGYEGFGKPLKRAGPPFNNPTDVALAASGDIYVSDGYGNARVHKFSPSGKLLFSWGEPGSGPGQFNLVHSVWEHKGRVYVADRQNNRVQVFTPEGKFITLWEGFVHPTKIYAGKDDVLYVAELEARVSIVDLNGKVLARWGGEKSHAPGEFFGPHGIWADSHGDLYVAEVLEGKRIQKFVRKSR